MNHLKLTINLCTPPAQKIKCGGVSINSNRYYNKQEIDELLELKLDVLSNVSLLVNDAKYVTEAFLEAKKYLTEHLSLKDYARKSDIPTNVSTLLNDAGYITSDFTYSKNAIDLLIKNSAISYDDTAIKQLIAKKADKSEIPTDYVKSSQLNSYALKTDIPAPYDDTAIRNALNNKADKSEIPTDYVKSNQLTDYALKSEIPDTTNFATKNEIPSVEGLASESYVDNKIGDIESILLEING